MAITQVGSAMTGSSASSGSFSITKPTGVQDGDLLIMIGASNMGAWNTFPSGWTQLAVSSDGSMPNNFRAYMWYKVASSEGASYTFGSTTAASQGAPMVGLMVAYRGVDTSNPFPNLSTDILGSLAAGGGNPNVSFTQTDLGRQFFVRFSRSTSGSPSYSTSTSGWAINGQIARNSGGSVTYALCWVPRDADDGPGSRVEPGVPSGVATTDNFYILGLLKAQADPSTGTFSATTPSITADFAGTMTTPSGTASVTLSNPAVAFTGTAAPPEGPLDVTLPSPTVAFVGNSIGGSFSTTLSPLTVAAAGAVNPLGAFSATLSSVTAAFVAETQPFGEHVIRPEHESRAFRVTDDDTGLVYLKKRSQVTDL
jgi:hypothetical protein